jgi:hypothetical protein
VAREWFVTREAAIVRKGVSRWNTRFGRRMKRLGVAQVLRRVHQAGVPITRQALYNYLAGARAPGLEVRTALSRLGFNLADIDQHILYARSRPSPIMER